VTTPYERFPSDWLASLLALRHTGRIARITLTMRNFQTRGIQFKCDNGPWRDSLPEAISAHKTKYLEDFIKLWERS
jgi:hypothetical protein